MKEDKYFRVISGDLGIYEAVDKDCPKSDPRREHKPDGSWLNKAGVNYPGAISLWTRRGLEKYIASGLLSWHQSVVSLPVKVQIVSLIPEGAIFYKDDLQIIVSPQEVTAVAETPIAEFTM